MQTASVKTLASNNNKKKRFDDLVLWTCRKSVYIDSCMAWTAVNSYLSINSNNTKDDC